VPDPEVLNFAGPVLGIFSQHRSIFPTEENVAWSLCSLSPISIWRVNPGRSLPAGRQGTNYMLLKNTQATRKNSSRF
jgi:hypothetical protein